MSAKQRNWSSIIGLFFFLIVLPVGSYIYLKKGYDYQKKAMADLRKEHRLTGTVGLVQLGDSTASLRGGDMFYLLGLLPKDAPLEPYKKTLQRLHHQFDEPTNLELWTVSEGAADRITGMMNSEMPTDTAQLKYWTANGVAFNRLVDEMQLLAEERSQLNEGLMVLVDDSLYVRRAFSVQDEAALGRLVERVAILLPERGKPKPILRPEPEM